MNELQAVAAMDPANEPNASELEVAALTQQRAAYDRIHGTNLAAEEAHGPEQEAVEALELIGADDDDILGAPEQVFAPEEHLAEDDDLEEDQEDDEEQSSADADDDELAAALSALRRVNAPDWVFDETRKRILALAKGYADQQSNLDRVSSKKDERIRELEARATAGSTSDESPGDWAVPARDHLNREADQLARALGIEDDEDAKKALVSFGSRIMGPVAAVAADHKELVEALRSVAATNHALMVLHGKQEMGARYPQLLSDPNALDNFQSHLETQTSTGNYKGKLSKLFQDAAMLAFGVPKKSKGKEDGRRDGGHRRRAGRPLTRSKTERKTRVRAGSLEHQRQVFDRVRAKSRAGLTAGRR